MLLFDKLKNMQMLTVKDLTFGILCVNELISHYECVYEICFYNPFNFNCSVPCLIADLACGSSSGVSVLNF